VGANGVLNRISEDGVLTAWFRKPHNTYGTSHRLINTIAILQCITIVLSRGDVYLLAALYAFGVIWSFSFKSLAVLVLRFTEPGHRDFRVPGNITIGKVELPIGLALITILLFAVALVNLMTKPLATEAGIAFSIFLYIVFTISEKITHRTHQGDVHQMREEFRVTEQPLVDREEMKVRPGNIVVAIRDPRNLYYLRDILRATDSEKQDIVVMTARIYHREPTFSGDNQMASEELFDSYEQELFTKVVELAEKEGKHVSLMVVPSANVFDAIVQTGARLESSRIVCGLSNRLTLDEQGKLTGDAWERLPEPRPNIALEIRTPDNAIHEYYLGPHTPRLREQDLDLLHRIWLQLTAIPGLEGLHHYHIVGLSLGKLEERLQGPQREEIIELFRQELARDQPIKTEETK
jgi:hypothetical protein